MRLFTTHFIFVAEGLRRCEFLFCSCKELKVVLMKTHDLLLLSADVFKNFFVNKLSRLKWCVELLQVPPTDLGFKKRNNRKDVLEIFQVS